MATHWLKALGSKLLDTGAAYLQQARLVQELKQLPLDQAQERFFAYVNGLSAAARAGFSLTLTTLANSEAGEGRRFLEMLRASLANPAAWKTGGAPEPPAPQFVAQPASPASHTLLDDMKLLDVWMALDDKARPGAIEQYITSLQDVALDTFKRNLEEGWTNITVNIDNHHESEVRIAAGRFIEDQQIYRLGRVAGGPPDAAWLEQLREYERVKAFIELVHQRVSAVQDERRKPPPTAPAGATPEQKAESAPRGRKPENATRPVPNWSQGVEAMRQMLEEQLASGRVAADRASAFRRTLDKIENIAAAQARGDIGSDVANAQMQELISDHMRYLADPGTVSTKATPRGRELLRYAGVLKTNVARVHASLPPIATAEAVSAIVGDVTQVQTDIEKTHEGRMLTAIEAELLRPAAQKWHEFTLTRNAVLAKPLWEANEVTRSVNTIFYSGASDLQASLEQLAEPKRLTIDTTRRLQNHGQSRWDVLTACHVAVFDLRGASDIESLATRAPKKARELTGTAYELGLAFALGKPVVIIGSPGESLPFDIDLSPVLVDGTDDDQEAIAQALDEAFYIAQREGRNNAIAATVAELDRLTRNHPKRVSIEGMGWLDPELAKDPASFLAAVRQVLREIGQPQLQLLRPAWPGAYPDADHPRCFHVMPFRPPWADETRDVARAACTTLGLDYRRGDEAEEGRIIHAIWDDLCRAHVVLVELHGGNLNVMIELGIAHALGRPVLAVQKGGGADLRPRHIEKLRVHTYNTAEELHAVLMSRFKV